MTERISAPGTYSGYSPHEFPEYSRATVHVPGAGGVLLAADIFRPGSDGTPTAEALPVVVMHYRPRPGGSPGAADAELQRRGCRLLLSHGYVIVWLQQRGRGASFGTQRGFVTPLNGEDVKQAMGWIERQPWCDGNIVMMGGSHGGLIQWVTATRRPKGLRAITPTVTTSDFYSVLYPNGVSALGGPGQPGAAPREGMRVEPTIIDAPVDDDPAPDYPLWQAAQREHAGMLDLPDEWLPHMWRDSMNPVLGYPPGLVDPPVNQAESIRAADLAIYQFAGWHDLSPAMQMADFRRYGGRILVGPWTHQIGAEPQPVEHLRFFDWLLKGIPNGVGDEPPVYYSRLDADGVVDWHFAAVWPLSSASMHSLFLADGPSGSVASVNDGILASDLPEAGGRSSYRTAFDIAAFDGRFLRLDRFWKGDMTRGVDERGLTFTAPPLVDDVEVTGHPAIELWVDTTATDGDLIAWLEDVDGDGKSRFVTDGQMRLSHRREMDCVPLTEMGLTYHPSAEADCSPVAPGEVVRVRFDLSPISYIFRSGHRIRLTLTAGESATYQQPPGVDPADPPVLSVHHGVGRPSRLDLPMANSARNGVDGMLKVDDPSFSYEGEATLYHGPDKLHFKCGDRWLVVGKDNETFVYAGAPLSIDVRRTSFTVIGTTLRFDGGA